MARKKKAADVWGDDPLPRDGSTAGSSDAPLSDNTNAPGIVLMQKRHLMRRFMTYAVVWFGIPAMLLLGASIFTQEPEFTPEDFVTDSLSVNDSIGKAQANAAILSWLEAESSPLPGGRLISWDGFEYIDGEVAENSSDAPADPQEVHYFTLASTSGQITLLYTATVLVSVNDSLGALVQGTPSLIPRAADADSGWSQKTWAGYEQTNPGQPVVEAVDAWSRAFTSGTSDLRLHVGDQDPTHSYVPLLGATVVGANITASGAKPADGDATAEPADILVRVQVSIRWTADEEEKPTTVTYDLLVDDANTGAPRVVAWGAPGDGPKLTPFENALTDLTVNSSIPTAAPVAPSDDPEEPTDDIEEGE